MRRSLDCSCRRYYRSEFVPNVAIDTFRKFGQITLMELKIDEAPSAELMQFFNKKIEEFNVARWEVKEKKPVVIKIEDQAGRITAGVAAKTFGLWLLIENLWVSDELRGQQIGSKILKKLEDFAIGQGCKYALLDTLNFQAKPFYEKYGYAVEWTQNKYPKDGCKYFMVKKLMEDPS